MMNDVRPLYDPMMLLDHLAVQHRHRYEQLDHGGMVPAQPPVERNEPQRGRVCSSRR